MPQNTNLIHFLTLNLLLISSTIPFHMLNRIFILAILLPLCTSAVEKPDFFKDKENYQFHKLTVAGIETSVAYVNQVIDQYLKNITQIQPAKRTFNNTVLPYDDLFDEIVSISSPLYLMGSVHPDSSLRNASLKANVTVSRYVTDLMMNESLYKAMQDYSKTPEAVSLTGYKKKYLDEVLRKFERNGFALPADQRELLKDYQNKINETGTLFNSNIAAYDDFLMVGEDEVAALPDQYKTTYRTSNGKYKINLSYPSYLPFMKKSTSDQARKELFIKYHNKAAETNAKVLQDMISYRHKMAKLLGYPTFAKYQIEERMAKTPETVWTFEKTMMEKVKEKARADYEELLEIKSKTTGKKETIVEPWEVSFYTNILMEEKYSVNEAELKEYFELNNVLDGLFKITQQLFELKYEEVKDASIWHPDVRKFKVLKNNQTIGYFYLDLHPRPNKYGHAACFDIVSGKQYGEKYQKPVAALVCNFPKASGGSPALLSHREVETFFHEFGHVLHNLMTTAPLVGMSGTNVARDFVEAPSQIFENWTWEYESLKLFAKHYKTGEVIPRTTFDKMVAAKNVGSGIAALRQVFFGYIDMTLHDKYDPESNQSINEIVKNLQNEITLFPFIDGTHFECSFGHLNGYGAGYYGYLWARVYSDDMFSKFKEQGIMNAEIGKKYRDIILAKGSTEDEFKLVIDFLGREPSQQPFLQNLGLIKK